MTAGRRTGSVRALVAAAVLFALLAGPVAVAGAASSAQEPGFATAGQEQPSTDATVTRVAVEADGAATWTLEIRTRLETEDEVAEFERFQASFRENRSRYLDEYRDRMTGVVAGADASADREMRASNFEAATRVESAPQRWGVVTYRFRWDGFAAVEGDRLVVGDVFAGGFYLEETSVLELELPAGYEVASVEPAPDERGDRQLEWHGQETFDDERPRVVAAPVADGPSGWLLPAAGLAALLGAVGLAWRLDLPARLRSDRSTDGAETGGGADPPTHEPVADPEPVTDDDRVRRVLRERGGRCKQSEIVAELDWSKSKTSRVLSRMDEDGAVEKLRVGRENVVELADEDARPAATDR